MTSWQEGLFTPPRRVAVVGASASPRKAGALFLPNLTLAEAGFRGEVIAIHPMASQLLGCPAYPCLRSAPEPVDFSSRGDSAGSSSGCCADCGTAQVPVAVIISGGFAETGAGGAELQREVARIATATGVHLLGPNCFGVINTASGLNCSLSIGLPGRGGVSLVTQSGASGMAAFSRSIDEGLGFARLSR